MPDDPIVEPPPDPPPPPPPPPAPEGGKHADLEELERYRASIRRELEEFKTAKDSELQELRGALAKSNDWIEEQKKANEERDKSKGNQSTMVVPPHELAAPRQQENQPAGPQAPETASRKSKWRFY